MIKELELAEPPPPYALAISEVSVALSVLLKHILRLFRCIYMTIPMGLKSSTF